MTQTKSHLETQHVAPDCRGTNFWVADPALRALLARYLPRDVLVHLEPHLHRLGGLAGGALDELAMTAERTPTVLHPRDRFGRDEGLDRIPSRVPRHGTRGVWRLRSARHDP